MPIVRFLNKYDQQALDTFFKKTNYLLHKRTTQTFIDCLYAHLTTPIPNLRIAAVFEDADITAICIGCTAMFLWKEDLTTFPDNYREVFTFPWIQGLPKQTLNRKVKSILVTLVMRYFYDKGLKIIYIMVPWKAGVGINDQKKIGAIMRSNGHVSNVSHSKTTVRAILNAQPTKNIPDVIKYLFFHNNHVEYPQAIIRIDLITPLSEYYESLQHSIEQGG